MDRAKKAEQITDAVRYVARSKARFIEFAPGQFADAVSLAAGEGYLSFVGNGVVELAEEGKSLMRDKDPEGVVLNRLAINALMQEREAQGLPRFIDLSGLISDN